MAVGIQQRDPGCGGTGRGHDGHYARWFVLGMAAYVLAFYAFARSLQSIPTSTADAIHFAASTAIIAVVGVTVLRHRLTARKAAGLVLVVAGVVVLRTQAAGV